MTEDGQEYIYQYFANRLIIFSKLSKKNPVTLITGIKKKEMKKTNKNTYSPNQQNNKTFINLYSLNPVT